MKYKIVLDAGHGGKDTGAIALNGEYEKDINLEVAMYLKDMLKEYDEYFEVITTRETDVYMSLSQRVFIANNKMANLFISCHHNSFNSKASGAETIHSIYGGQGQKFANLVAEEFKKIKQNIRRVFTKESTKNKGTDYFAVIRDTSMPAVITEFAFLDSIDFYKIDEAQERKNQAQAILKAILRYFNIKDKNVYDSHGVEIKDWQLKILDDAYANGVFKDYEYWKNKINDYMPSWAIIAMVNNMKNNK